MHPLRLGSYKLEFEAFQSKNIKKKKKKKKVKNSHAPTADFSVWTNLTDGQSTPRFNISSSRPTRIHPDLSQRTSSAVDIFLKLFPISQMKQNCSLHE